VVKELYGTTKTTRSADPADSKRKKNDGRPPDTVKELLMPKTKKKQLTLDESLSKKTADPKSKTTKKKEDPPPATSIPPPPSLSPDPPSYPWNRNSCWLDTSLQLLYVAMRSSVPEFRRIYGALPQGSMLRVVLASLLKRYDLDKANKTTSAVLRGQRDYLHKYLKRKQAIRTATGFESLFVRVLNIFIPKLLINSHHYRLGSANQ
jgi:hypothetical protein